MSRKASSGEVPLTGVVLTRMDGDARVVARRFRCALSRVSRSNLQGTGEKLDAD